MGGIDQRKKSIVLGKLLGLISKSGMSEVTKTFWRERQNKGKKLYKFYIPVIAKWFEPRKKYDIMELRVQLGSHSFAALPTSLPQFSGVNNIATTTKNIQMKKTVMRQSHT